MLNTTDTQPAELKAGMLMEDPEVRDAIETLVAKVEARQAELEARPWHDDLADAYAKRLESFASDRGGPTFFPYLGSGFGRGPLVELGDGRVVYDFITGIGAFPMGHSDPRLIRAQLEGALSDVVIQGNLQQNGESAAFLNLLVESASENGAELKHGFLSNTGVMAGENALKIAFQKNQPAHRVLAFKHCFAGRTISFSQITDKPVFREGLPETLPVDYIPFYDPADPHGSSRRAQAMLAWHLERHPGEYAAMFFELVQGEGGFNVGSRAFFEPLMRTCREAGVAVLVDEVQTFARTESLFAFQHFGLDAWVDVVWIGKASQACAMLYRPEFRPKPGLLSQTFTASTSAIRAGQVIIEAAREGGYYGKNGKLAQLHRRFVEGVEAVNARLGDRLRGPYGIGGMWAFTLDDGDATATKEFIRHLFNFGVMAFAAGNEPARVRFLPPFLNLSEKDIEGFFLRLFRALESFPNHRV